MPRTTHISVYLYHNNIVDTPDTTDPTPNVRCVHCGYMLGRARGRIFNLANTQAPGFVEIPLGLPAFEVKCPKCNTVHSLIWQ